MLRNVDIRPLSRLPLREGQPSAPADDWQAVDGRRPRDKAPMTETGAASSARRRSSLDKGAGVGSTCCIPSDWARRRRSSVGDTWALARRWRDCQRHCAGLYRRGRVPNASARPSCSRRVVTAPEGPRFVPCTASRRVVESHLTQATRRRRSVHHSPDRQPDVDGPSIRGERLHSVVHCRSDCKLGGPHRRHRLPKSPRAHICHCHRHPFGADGLVWVGSAVGSVPGSEANCAGHASAA